MKRALLSVVIILSYFLQPVHGQNVMDPTDAVITYDATADSGTISNPAVPLTGIMADWVRTKHPRVTWNTDAYKAYIWNGMAFRLRFPKNYNAQPNKKWPIIVFYHGGGEIGPIRDNEFHLLWGGQQFGNNADNNSFDCFILYPQQTSVGWEESYIERVNGVLDTLAKYNRLDEDRVLSLGLSAGGFGCVNHAVVSPKRIAKVIGSSPAYIDFLTPDIPSIIEIPHWLSSGGRDRRPDTFSMRKFLIPFADQGGSMIHSYYPTEGHFTWSRQWAEPIFIPELNSAHKANPVVFFGRNQFCPDSPVVARLGLTPGFFAYEWSKDGVTIAGATTNSLLPTVYGTYRARFKRTATSDWSEWSPTPVVVGLKSATITPPIAVAGLRSKVLPALDGSTSVPLQLSTGFTGYEWRNVGSPTIISNSRVYTATVGSYVGNVVEQFGCSSVASPIFKVVDANGTQKPDRAKNVAAFPISGAIVQVEWSKNASSVHPTNNFEIYRGLKPGGPYTLVGLNDANNLVFQDQGLTPNATYYYVVRAVNEFAASPTSNEVRVKTLVDTIAPSAPSDLKVIYQSREFIELSWEPSTDNNLVMFYDVYIDGKKTYTFDTLQTIRKIYNLNQRQYYNITVRARDESGNISQPSNQVTGGTFYSGLKYRYYEGNWTVLPNFNALSPLREGTIATFSIAPRLVNDLFGFVWEGYLIIGPGQAGNYQFSTRSDDGSKLYLNTFYNFNAAAIVNNDGLHGATTVQSGTINLPEGVYLITGTFFEGTSGESMQVQWRGPATNNAWVDMPASAFNETLGTLAPIPTMPSFVRAQPVNANQISVSWTDNSTNETGFEIARSTSATGPFVPVFTTGENVTSYIDGGLNANTMYYYQVRAIGLGGESAFSSNVTEANWRLNGNAFEETGNTDRNLTVSGAPITYDVNNKQEGSSSLLFTPALNTGALVNNSTSGRFPSDAYTHRTVSLWMRPGSINTKQIVFDFGGSNNGLALRINTNGTLTAGIASNSTRRTISSVAALTLNTWVHVSVVYSTSALRLFVNGVEVASNTSLGFTSIPAGSSSASRFGILNANTSGDNAFNDISYSNFSGLMDNIFVINRGLSSTEISAMMNNTYFSSHARTSVAPNAPTTPTGLIANAVSNQQVNISWTDNATTETAYQLFRSTGNNSAYRVLATLPANTTQYTDTACFPNVSYFYRVRAVLQESFSAYSNEQMARTFNTRPVIKDVADFTMRFGTTVNVPIEATDADDDDLTISFRSLPRFASFTPTSNGRGTLTLVPSMVHQGTYRFRFIATDPNNASDTMQFTVVVNDNGVPTIQTINNIVLNEGASSTTNVVANDAENAALISWTFQGLPSFATFTANGNGTGSLQVQPGYADAGVYTVQAKVNDGLGAWSTQAFTITVNERSPNTSWKINVQANNVAPAPWNNWNATSLNGLVNQLNQSTPLGISLSPAFGISRFEFGVNTGNNSGIYPDVVLRDNFYLLNGTDSLTLTVTGLNPAVLYNFRFMSATANFSESNTAKTGFRIGNRRDSVVVKNNSQNTAYIAGVAPNASGIATIVMYRSDGAQTAYLNALEIEANYADGTAPVKAQNLVGSFTQGIGNRLTWRDVAYNETSYQLYRATQRTGPYTLLNPGVINPNDTLYIDRNVEVSTQYYYYINATNSVGSSPNSDTISVLTGNNNPLIVGMEDIYVEAGASRIINFTVSDDASDSVAVSITGLPAFSALNRISSQNYSLSSNPTRNDIGVYYLRLTATDDKGGETVRNIRLSVSDNTTRTWLINFCGDGQRVARPWNNLSFGYAPAGLNVTNMFDDQNQSTNASLTLVTDFAQFDRTGFTTGNNSGVVPDSVLQTGLIEWGSTVRTFRLAGLDPTKMYSIGFVSSLNAGHPATTNFSVGAQTVTSDARYNADVQPRLNGLIPNASGQIDVNMQRPLTNTWYGYLNAVIVDEYDPVATTVLSPSNLKAEPLPGRTAVRLQWADRSSNETGGFEVYRGQNENGPFSLITTTAANTTWFTDSTVVPNTFYVYQVRAKSDTSTFSAYTNQAKTISSSGTVYVNINGTNPGNNGNRLWNNTGKSPVQGDVYGNLDDDIGFATGYTLTLQNNLGASVFGSSASPANSGVFPDSVLLTNYIVPKGQTVTYKVSGLDQTKRYRIGFSGSSGAWGKYNTTMTIGNRTVYLGAMFNTTKACFIADNVPNENGEIFINFSSTNESDNNYGIIGAILIQAYGDNQGGTIQNRIAPMEQQPVLLTNRGDAPLTIAQITAFPNPFTDRIQVSIQSMVPISQLTADLYDLSGRLIWRTQKGNLPAGNNILSLNVGSVTEVKGTYLLKISINDRSASVIKMIKYQ